MVILIIRRACTWLLTMFAATAWADQVTFKSDDVERTVDAEVIVEAVDGGLLIRGRDAVLHLLQPEQIVDRLPAEPGPMLDHEALATSVMESLPPGMTAHVTEHYVVIHRQDLEYARHVATLFETLHRAFFAFWDNQNVVVQPPDYPLVAILWPDQNSYAQYAAAQVGPASETMIGYYHLLSNQMVSYRIGNLERNVATLIHEATHQLAYNCSLQTRLADNPMWVSEGLAMFFESPELNSPRGWRGIGRVNVVNLNRYRLATAQGRATGRDGPATLGTSLQPLIAGDEAFADPAVAGDAYAHSWALTYFLIRTRRDDYLKYLQQLSDQSPLRTITARQKVAMFQESFGPIEQVELAFRRYMLRVRP